ncbi:MAG: TIGR03808 family TAT-translocated repetitive protein [Pseudomonadota bacterium]
MTKLVRRAFLGQLGACATGAVAGGLALSEAAHAAKPFAASGLRGSLDATQFGVRPDAFDDQSRLLQKVLDKAAREDRPVFLPPGVYIVSNINLPARTRLMGIAGTSRIIYGGGGAFLSGTGCDLIEMSGITLDGANRPMGETYGGLLYARACPRVTIESCDFTGSQTSGLSLDTCGGHVERSRMTGAAGLAGLFSVNATGLAIRDNVVSDCANGGILVHRWEDGEDRTIISGNRIENIAARQGGTGQQGNGINLFRTNGVMVSNNHVSDCAFSAIRANSASNAQMVGNTCLRSGETAVYAEFQFQGSMIANNIVDGGTIGISIANFNEGGRLAVCANNLVRNMKTDGPYPAEVAGFGIGIFAEADTNVIGNVVEGAPKYGIGLGWGPYLRNVMAANNIVREAGKGIAVSVVDGAGQTSITGNIFDKVRDGGVIGHRWTEAVTRDLVGGKRQPFPHLTVERNSVS